MPSTEPDRKLNCLIKPAAPRLSNSRNFVVGWALQRTSSTTRCESVRYKKSSTLSTRTVASMACHSCPRWRSTVEPSAPFSVAWTRSTTTEAEKTCDASRTPCRLPGCVAMAAHTMVVKPSVISCGKPPGSKGRRCRQRQRLSPRSSSPAAWPLILGPIAPSGPHLSKTTTQLMADMCASTRSSSGPRPE